MKNLPNKKSSGFTLVEMAIVLVIIGLILGGVLKGQELVVQARVKSIINDFNQVTAAYYTYFDRYRQFPGDDTTATTRWSTSANGSTSTRGSLVGKFNSTTASDETNLLWSHLRWSDVVNGSKAAGATAALLPTNAVGGLTGIQDEPIFGMNKTVVCMSSIPGKLAQLADYAIDDGKSDDGIMRSAEETTPGAAATGDTAAASGTGTGYDEDSTFTICRQL